MGSEPPDTRITHITKSDHSLSDLIESELVEISQGQEGDLFFSKDQDGIWLSVPPEPPTGRKRAHDILKEKTSPTRYSSRNCNSENSSFSLLTRIFTENNFVHQYGG